VDVAEEPRALRLENGWLRVPIPRHLGDQHRGRFVRAALIDWYKAHASRRIPERIVHWAARLDLHVPEVLLVEPRKRWGSASSSGTVRINWRVIQAPLALVDYVVAHELVHLRHPNHTRQFWGAIGGVMADYEVRKATLRIIGSQLDW
jgi:predicted metal-dependent hydrolase